MRRRGRTDPGLFQGVPLTARAQDEKDRVHRRAVGDAGIVTAERMPGTRRQQRLHPLPQNVRQPPSIVDNSPLDPFSCRLLFHPYDMG